MNEATNIPDARGSANLNATSGTRAMEPPLAAAFDAHEFGTFLSPASFLTSRHVDLLTVGPWMEHGPFAFWLMNTLRPSLFVELGTHTGFSYFSFCQAVKDFRLPTKCVAVDTWQGDEHATYYGEEVFTRVAATNSEQYSGFSQLIRARFDEALPRFGDGEVDLLHIDGRHLYGDVKEDFESWRPKLSSRGVVLFHDTNVRERDFGVWKLWHELSSVYPSFEFLHGYGLGVLTVGSEVPPSLRALFSASAERTTDIRAAYSQLGAAITKQRALEHLHSELGVRERLVEEIREDAAQRLAKVSVECEQAKDRAFRAERETAQIGQNLAETEAEHRKVLATLSRQGGKLLMLEKIEQRALCAKAECDEARSDLLMVTGELDAIRYSTIWRAARPLRTLLGSDAAKPVRKILRRTARAVYRAATLQGRKRYEARQETKHGVVDLAIPATEARVDGPSRASQFSPTNWYSRFRHGADYGSVSWQGLTRFSILMPVYKVRPQWLEDAIASVLKQTYPHWELICVDDNSQNPLLSTIMQRAASDDPRVRSVTLDRNQGVSNATNVALAQSTGDYVLFMDHDDLLEPHALARLGDAAFREGGDILYGDEVVTGEDPENILGVQARPIFSHTYYMSHPFFVHPVAVRTRIAREIGGLDASLKISHDIDFVLRALEVADKVTHVPDILYRWRTSSGSAGHAQKAAVMAATCAIKTAHLRRIGFPDAEVREGISFNTFSVKYFGGKPGRVLGIIPTKNQGQLLKLCIESLRETTKDLDLDLLVIDHESDDAESLSYMRSLEEAGIARVLPYQGTFNYSAINNHAVQACGTGYDYLLFLNNDIEATKPGWLSAMLDLAARSDVGVVGATLLYPSGLVQHSGVIVGLNNAADHAFRSVPFGADDPGYGASLHATREYSAVTAACMLVPQEVFDAVEGFDEKLEVGFSDTDLCLRIGQKGYRTVNCAEAILVHHESATRGKEAGRDPHPQDSALFKSRYKGFIQAVDPHFSHLLSQNNPTFILNSFARLTSSVQYGTVSDCLPKRRRVTSVAPLTEDERRSLAHGVDGSAATGVGLPGDRKSRHQG
jgi:GT2 family glycosyltransferase